MESKSASDAGPNGAGGIAQEAAGKVAESKSVTDAQAPTVLGNLSEPARLLDDLEGEVVVADEWGVFEPSQFTQIQDALDKARAAIKRGASEEAGKYVLGARRELNAVTARKRLWLINNRYGGLPLLLTAASAYLTYECVLSPAFSSVGVFDHPAFGGLIGAILKNLYWIQFQASRGKLRPRWCVSFIVAAPIGVILGWITSLVISGVLRAASTGVAQPDPSMVMVVAIFAGFKWQWAVGWLEEVAKGIRSQLKEKAAKPK